MEYFFSSQDPRLNKHFYSFSGFQDKDFVKAWYVSRNKFLNNKLHIDKTLNSSYKFDNKILLTYDYLYYLVIKTINNLAGNSKHLDFIERKFNVSNSLRVSYDFVEAKINDKNFANSDVYPFLAFLIAKKLNMNTLLGYRMLNSLCKLNDIISFLSYEKLSNLGKFCGNEAVKLEVSFIKKELKRNKLNIL